ncbi:MAG: hypothetical protein PV347_01150 [Rickettsiaceae bacterium]|nr:hypothetical protein [Rickettsiaceae bacterium]
MNFFDDRELALRFKNNAVSSKERFWYFMIRLIIGIVILKLPLNVQVDVYKIVLSLGCAVIGTIICYNTNKAGDDKEFIERCICIGFPVMIRTLVYLTPALIIFLVLLLPREVFIFKEMIIEVIWELVWSFCYYWRLNSAIRIAAN